MNRRIFGLIFIMILVTTAAFAEEALVMDSNFFKKFSSQSAMARDEYLEGFLDKLIIGRGKIVSVTEKGRYRKRFMVTIESSDSSKFNQKFLFYLFLDNRDNFDLLSTGSDFEFKGQFMGYTPLNTKRNSYIIDAVLMDASTLIDK